MSYPNRDHGIWQGVNTTLHLRRTMENFWKLNL
jgi:dipeptidyl-peptidase 4